MASNTLLITKNTVPLLPKCQVILGRNYLVQYQYLEVNGSPLFYVFDLKGNPLYFEFGSGCRIPTEIVDGCLCFSQGNAFNLNKRCWVPRPDVSKVSTFYLSKDGVYQRMEGTSDRRLPLEVPELAEVYPLGSEGFLLWSPEGLITVYDRDCKVLIQSEDPFFSVDSGPNYVAFATFKKGMGQVNKVEITTIAI